ncbi:MAG: aminotransferase class V-fold PLP-dependent enzyme [Tepidisphaeraceae bacterium]
MQQSNIAGDEAFWLARRAEMDLDPESANFNTGTLSPTPRPVLEAVTRLRQQQSSAPSDFCWRQLPKLINASRAALAAYLNCRAFDLLLLPNVTFAINLAAWSLELPPGSEILTTDHEYGAMVFLWKRIAKERDLRYLELTLPYRTDDPSEIIRAFERAISLDTRVLFISHCTCTTGLVLPVREIVELARARGILTVIDGAHAVGTVPVDLEEINADFYAANCHKWLMAPAGAGFLHAASTHKPMMKPLITSWGYDYDRSAPDQDSNWGGSFWQRDLEFHGTVDRCAQMVLPEALAFRKKLGGDEAIRSRSRTLVEYCRARMIDAGLTPAISSDPRLCAALVAFDFQTDDLIRTRDQFWFEHHIECPVTEAAGRRFLRVSCAWFNTTGDLDRLATALKTVRGASL